MLSYGTHDAIVSAHDAKAFEQRMVPVACCQSLGEVVCEYESCVVEGLASALGILHNAYAPIKVGAESIRQIVGMFLGKVCTHVETLVTYKHTTQETSPVQLYRCL